MLKDQAGYVYLVSRHAKHVMKKYAVLGSVGSGRIAVAAAEAKKAIPFQLDRRDKRFITVSSNSAVAAPEGEDNVGEGSGSISGSLYSRQAIGEASSREVTSRQSGCGQTWVLLRVLARHSRLERLRLHRQGKRRQDKCREFFRTFITNRQTASSNTSAVMLAWKFSFSAVHGRISPRKPQFVLSSSLALEKDKPVKIVSA